MPGERVLLVDDEPHITELVQLYLDREGYTIHIARDGRAALEAVDRVARKFTPTAQAQGVTLQSDFENAPSVLGDADRLTQVFSNLVDNAIRHSPPAGAVTLSAGAESGAALITVRDKGPGIPPEDQGRIFERFYQVDKSRARAGDRAGFGLGLAIARELVHAHGGEIHAHNAPGRGAVFMVKLPLA